MKIIKRFLFIYFNYSFFNWIHIPYILTITKDSRFANYVSALYSNHKLDASDMQRIWPQGH